MTDAALRYAAVELESLSFGEEYVRKRFAFSRLANPTTILSLLDRLAQAERERDEARRHSENSHDLREYLSFPEVTSKIKIAIWLRKTCDR